MRKSYSGKRSKAKKVDRLSGLPDHLLCRILAFLPTRSAVATSVLSQRWEHLWPRIPVLDFTYNPDDVIAAQQKYRSFKHYLNRVLLHNKALCLERVDFDVLPVMPEEDWQECFMVLSRRSIKEVNFFCDLYCDLPLTNLLGDTAGEHLVKLNIVWGDVSRISVSITSMLHFPRLEIVHLMGVYINDGEPISSLVHGSPCLRELVLSKCEGLVMNFRCSTLKILKLLDCDAERTNIGVPNLEHFELILDEEYHRENDDYDAFQFLIDDMPCLCEAKIYKCQMRAATWAYLFHKLRHVTKLDVSLSNFMDEKNPATDFKLPDFERLNCLEIRCYEEFSLLETRFYLSHMPYCVSLIIHMEWSFNCDNLLKFWPTNDSSSLGLHVEHIEIYDIGKTRLASVELMRYLLACFKGLKEVKLHLYHSISSGWKKVMPKMIMDLPRPSTCKITFCD